VHGGLPTTQRADAPRARSLPRRSELGGGALPPYKHARLSSPGGTLLPVSPLDGLHGEALRVAAEDVRRKFDALVRASPAAKVRVARADVAQQRPFATSALSCLA